MTLKNLFLATVVVVSANAAAAPFTNGSFELGPTPGSFVTLGSGNTSINGWTVGGAGVDYIGSYWQAADGGRSLDLSALSAGSVSQTIDTVAGQVYEVKFWMSGNPAGGSQTLSLQASADTQSNNYSHNTAGTSLSNMGWTERTFMFTADDTSATLTFTSLSGTAYGPALDDISVQAVPEPASLALLGIGLAGIARRRNRR